jgi:hypothetical protein
MSATLSEKDVVENPCLKGLAQIQSRYPLVAGRPSSI